jgi:hypothetical protein
MSAIGLEQPDSDKQMQSPTPAAKARAGVLLLCPTGVTPKSPLTPPTTTPHELNRNAAHFAAAQPIVTRNVRALNRNPERLAAHRARSERFFATQHAKNRINCKLADY